MNNKAHHNRTLETEKIISKSRRIFFLFLIIYEKRPFDIFLTEAPKLGKGPGPQVLDTIHAPPHALCRLGER